MVQLLWKTVWNFLKKLKTELPYDPAIPLTSIYAKEFKQDLEDVFAHLCSLHHYLQYPRAGSNPKGPLRGEWIKKRCYVKA